MNVLGQVAAELWRGGRQALAMWFRPGQGRGAGGKVGGRLDRPVQLGNRDLCGLHSPVREDGDLIIPT